MDSNMKIFGLGCSEHIDHFYRGEEKYGHGRHTPSEIYSLSRGSIHINQWRIDLMWLKTCLKWMENTRHLCFSHLISQICELENAQVPDMEAINQLIHVGCIELTRVVSIPILPSSRIIQTSFTCSFDSRPYTYSRSYTSMEQNIPYVFVNDYIEDTVQLEPHKLLDADEELPYLKRLTDTVADEESPFKKQRLSDAGGESTYMQILSDALTTTYVESPYKKQKL